MMISKQALSAMECSKLFSGSLPELSTCIIQYFHDDRKTLYYLALVNRFWCRLAIPLLWENTFFNNSPGFINPERSEGQYMLIDTYFLSLNDDDKIKLKELKNTDLNLHDKPLFNYPSFLKTLDFSNFGFYVTEWFKSTQQSLYSSVKKPNLSLIRSRGRTKSSAFINPKIVYPIFLKLFIENNVSLNELSIQVGGFHDRSLFEHFICVYNDMITSNPKFLSEIKIFSVCYHRSYLKDPNEIFNLSQKFLSLLSLSTSIKHAKFNFDPNYYKVEKCFIDLFQS